MLDFNQYMQKGWQLRQLYYNYDSDSGNKVNSSKLDGNR